MAQAMTLVGLDVHARQTHAAVLSSGIEKCRLIGIERCRSVLSDDVVDGSSHVAS